MSGLIPCSPAYDNSRFCFYEFAKLAHEHHLQVLPSLHKPDFVSFTGTLKATPPNGIH
jgi:hypothetical protein